MKVGDKVKVKSWEGILKTLDGEYYCQKPCKNGDKIYFNGDNMFQYVNLIGIISSIDNNTGNVLIKFTNQPSSWWWHPSWLELISEESDVAKDYNPKWLIFCMIFQYLSGNCPNPHIFKDKFTPTKINGGFDFIEFKYDFVNIQWEKVSFPDWPILNIPVDEAHTILEHCYKYGESNKTLEFFTRDVSTIVYSGFLWENTPEGDEYWSNYNKAINLKVKLEKSLTQQKISTTQIKTKNYEIKLQEKRGIILRGTVPEGNKQSSRKYEASIVSRPLGYAVCSGR